MMMTAPRLIITGASGFVGRHLLEVLKEDYLIYGLARRSQARSGAPVHPNITWFQVDIGDRKSLEDVFKRIRAEGGAEILIHLAAHYDFTGEEHPEYYRTNVEGLRNVLDLSKAARVRWFLFSSSVAACQFPKPGSALDETSAPDGDHIYARTKGIGERMLREYRDAFQSVIVRFAALFSDWCEYPPLYVFLDTWLSSRWNRRVLGGKGLSAIPYLHIQEIPRFFTSILDRLDDLAPEQVLIASPDGSVSHLELFESAGRDYFGQRVKPVFMPKALCGPGIRARDLLGRVTGERPFERPWMAEYIDLAMNVNSLRSRQILSWGPRPRLELLRRMPFLIESFKTDPVEWNRRNRAAMKEVRLHSYLRIHQLLEQHEQEICDEYTARLTGPEGRERFASYQSVTADEHEWNQKLILRHLMNAVRTRERAVFVSYCGDLAERRFHEGYRSHEVCDALQILNQICFKILLREPEGPGLKDEMYDHITTTLRAGCDRAQEVFEEFEATEARRLRREAPSASRPGREP
jgi:nucleoside-diphosphate-sugar epimerase